MRVPTIGVLLALVVVLAALALELGRVVPSYRISEH